MKKRRIISMLLAVLAVLGAGKPQLSRAETKPINIKSIYNMTDEEASKKVKLSEIRAASITIDNRPISLPVLIRELKIVRDESSITDLQTEITKKDFNEIFYNSKYPNGLPTNSEFEKVVEISSGEMVCIYYKGDILSNEKYFENLYISESEGIKSKVGEITLLNSIADLYNSQKTNPKIDFEREVTIKEFIKIYEAAVGVSEWPVEEVQKINSKLILPKFNDDFLNTKIFVDGFYLRLGGIEGDSLHLCEVQNKNGIIESVLLTYYKLKERKMYDLISGSCINVTKSFSNPDDKYFKSIGINSNGKLLSYTGILGLDLFHTTDPTPKERIYRDLIKKFQKADTVGELLEIYSYIPEGFEPDYSKFDFRDNPNIDPAWLANQPTPPPYAELTLGSRGQEVLDMKARFYELGYFRTDKYNDQYSRNTADTVRLFEENNSLPVDGVADAVMLGVLFSERAVGK